LHGGDAPQWLFRRMTQLAREIALLIASDFGPDELLRRLSDPFWFQAFGCVLGFDWHSSGVTTTTCGALKEGLRPLERELGIFVCGGKGRVSRNTPNEIERACETSGRAAGSLVYASRMSAKVDSAAVQDGYQIYHHCFIFTRSGLWCVVQQGMNEVNRTARRYHWLSSGVEDFVCEPHAAVCCDTRVAALNLVARESGRCRAAIASIAAAKPDEALLEIERATHLALPARHPLSVADIDPARLRKVLLATYEGGAQDFAAVLATPGLGAKSLRALSLISELIYGAAPSFRDPARFSYAHGGKDGHPYPVDCETYGQSIEVLRRAVSAAKMGEYDRTRALRRLAAFDLEKPRPRGAAQTGPVFLLDRPEISA
jgi:hypothetical protein